MYVRVTIVHTNMCVPWCAVARATIHVRPVQGSVPSLGPITVDNIDTLIDTSKSKIISQPRLARYECVSVQVYNGKLDRAFVMIDKKIGIR